MREILTILAIGLILVLTAALVGPYLVDWNAQRAEIEARLSQLLDAQVTVAGPIDVKLLPRPIFRLADLSVHGNDPGAGTVTATRADMELSLTALLRGAVEFVDADVTGPVISLTADDAGRVRLPRLGADAADRVSLLKLSVQDGTIVVRGSNGAARTTVTGITGSGDAESLAGPFKFAGTVGTARGALGVRVATGALENGRLRLKLTLHPLGTQPRLDLDGIAAATGPDASTLRFEGTAAAAGTLPLPGDRATVPWRLAGKIAAEAGRLTFTEGELRAGADGRAVIATAEGEVAGGDVPAAHLALRARQVDVGKLAVAREGGDAADATLSLPGALAALEALGSDAELTAALPLPVTVDAAADTLSAGGVTLVGLAATLTGTAGQPIAGSVSTELAEGGRVRLDGAFEPGPAAVFKGRMELATDHLGRVAGSLAGDLPDIAALIRRTLPVESVKLSGTVDLSAIGFAARELAVTLDRSSFAGTVTLTRGVGADRARLFADLTSEALDLEAMPDWRDTASAAADLDVSLTLVAHALRLATSDTGDLSAGRIAMKLNKLGRIVTVDRLSLTDVGGANAELRGRSDGSTLHAEGTLDARRLRDLLTVAARVLPGSVTGALLARADALSPALLTVAADARLGEGLVLAPTLLTLDGTAGATRLKLGLRPDAGGTDKGVAVELSFDAPDAAVLLRQVGLPAAGGAALGRGRLEGTARRDPSGALSGALKARIGDLTLSATGSTDASGAVTTTIDARGPDAAPLGRSLGLATPAAGTMWPFAVSGKVALANRRLTVSGVAGQFAGTAFKGDFGYALPSADPSAPPPDRVLTGSLSVDRLPLPVLASLVLGPLPAAKPGAIWPDAPFAPALLTLPRGELALSAPALPLLGTSVARDGRATLRLEPGALTLADLSATLGDGRIGATMTLRRDGAIASMAGHLRWSGLPVASPSLGGTARGELDLAGSGVSAAAVASSLAGSGTLALEAGRLPRFNPDAISRVIAGIDASGSTLDEGTVASALGQELDHGALPLGTVQTPVTVAAGVMRAAPVQAFAGPVTADVSGSLSLATLDLTLRTTATLDKPSKDWVGTAPQVSVIWRGPLAAPARVVDAATLVNGVAARAIARDQARIEAFQDDIRERAFFARRLKMIEAEQQAVRDKIRADAEADRQRLLQSLPGGTTGGAPADPVKAPLPPRRVSPGARPMDLH